MPKSGDEHFVHEVIQKDLSVLSTKQPTERNRRRVGLLHQWMTSIILTLAYLIVGTGVGWASPILYHMQETGEPMNLTSSEKSLMVSLFYVGNVLMPIPGGFFSDYRGRKQALMIFDSLAFLSWVLIYFAKHPAMLHVARLMAGMWCGLVLTVVPLYIGEIAEPGVRGSLMTVAQIMINAGLLLAYILGHTMSYWAVAAIFGTIPLIFSVLIIFIPESPHWLIMKGSMNRSAKSLAWYRGCKTQSEVEDEFNIMTKTALTNMEAHGRFKMLFSSKGYRKAVFIVEVLSISQRLSGITAICAYSSVTLPDKTLGNLTPNDCVIILGGVFLISPIVVVFLVDKFGRIPLMIMSCTGCGINMFAACVYYFLFQSPSEYAHGWIPFMAFLGYGFAFNIGMGPLPTLLQGEMLPANMKGVASGITVTVMAATSSFVNGVYLLIAENIGLYMNFLIYTVTALACGIFSCTYMLETKGKSLYEIQQKLGNM